MIFFKNVVLIICFCVHISVIFSEATFLNILKIDERWICNIKKSCQACLQLPQCSWCPTENKCFSESLPQYEKYCAQELIRYPSYHMSLEDNAMCACADPEIQKSCPAGDSEPYCSGRGKCVCGRCFCDTNPDPLHHSKTIMGEHCEYDNFSCDGPKCNEGPYYIYEENEPNDDEHFKNEKK